MCFVDQLLADCNRFDSDNVRLRIENSKLRTTAARAIHDREHIGRNWDAVASKLNVTEHLLETANSELARVKRVLRSDIIRMR